MKKIRWVFSLYCPALWTNYLDETRTQHHWCNAPEARFKSSQVKFIYIAQYHKSHICLKGLYILYSIRHTLPLDPWLGEGKNMKNMDPGGHQTTPRWRQTDLSHMTSSPPWRPGTGCTQEAKLKHTIHTDGRKETNTQGRERETGTRCTQGREIDKRRGWISWRTKIQIQISGMKHWQPGARERERSQNARRSNTEKPERKERIKKRK